MADTSRAPRITEDHGKQYYFVSEESMQKDMASHRFLEYGTHENAFYGTKLDTIRDVINGGYIAVLDVEPPVITLFYSMHILCTWRSGSSTCALTAGVRGALVHVSLRSLSIHPAVNRRLAQIQG